jgi:hypothetical protein
MGTVLLFLSLFGKIPSEMLRLKICDSGRLMGMEIALSREVLIPSRSRLFLDSKFWIVVCTVAGEVRPSESSGGFGLGGMKSSGSRQDGFMDWPRLLPL